MLDANGPLFRDDLIAEMRSAGVDNLECFNVSILDPDDGRTHSNYKAVNILGLIAAADMARSEATIHPGGPPVIDVDFDSLVVDESRTHGALIFRLAESTNAILAHQRLRDHLVAKGFDDLAFYDPGEVAL
jgi:hypothetical protein